MQISIRRLPVLLSLTLSLCPQLACTDDPEHEHGHCGDGHFDDECPFAQTLFVAHEGSLVGYDIASREEHAGAVTDITGPVDLQALEDGTVMVNLTGTNEILAIDGMTMLELARIRSSTASAVRPVHSYVSPERGGRRYWLALNDGEEGELTTNSAVLVDISPNRRTRFEIVGEVGLGIGHHKASFSSTLERFVASNIADCENVISVYDYSDLENIEELATFSGSDAGFDGTDPGAGNFDPTFCDPTFERGLPPAPHGCTTSSLSGKAYCSVTNSGEIVAVDIDAEPPAFERIASQGRGGGFMLAHPDGRYIYGMQEEPREGGDGANCQIGQIVVIDAVDDTLVAELPVRYRGPDCDDILSGTAAETANFAHVHFSQDGETLFVPTSGGFNVTDARVDQVVVIDTSDPTNPAQLESISVGTHTGHSSSTVSGDGSWLFVVHTVDATVSQIDMASRRLVATFEVGQRPKVVATFGTAEGPSEQTGPVAR
jgi:hypothetical protein